MTDRIKEKMNQLRKEAEVALERAEAAEAKLKEYENQNRQRENELLSLRNKVALLEQVRPNARGVGAAVAAAQEGTAARAHPVRACRGSRRIRPPLRIVARAQDLDRAEERIAEAKNTANNADVKGTTRRRRCPIMLPALGRTAELTVPYAADGHCARCQVGTPTRCSGRSPCLSATSTLPRTSSRRRPNCWRRRT